MPSRLTSGPARVPLVFLVLILVWGACLRFANLGLNTLASDEMNHYFVGQALEQQGEPVLPSGTRYTRGLEYSKLVAMALPHFDSIEVAVRVPSAVIGTLALIVFAVLAWKMTGPWPAVISTTLFVLYPEGLRLSRFGRFYTMQLLAGLVALYFCWKFTRDPLTEEGFNRRRLFRDWMYFLLATASFAYAASVQVTTISVIAGFLTFVALIGVYDLWRHGKAAWKWSVPVQLTTLGVVAAAGTVLASPGIVAKLWQEARTMPMWARLSSEGPGPVSAYYRRLSSHFPLLVSLSPLAFLVAFFRDRRTGGLLLAWFAVPLFLHSFLFPWKSERYILLAVPALFLVSGVAAAVAMEGLVRYFEKNLGSLVGSGRVRPASAVLVAGVAVGALVTNPAFNVARRMKDTKVSAGWEESMALLRQYPALNGVPIGSAQPLVALHYWGKLDFTVQRALLESWRRDSTTGDFDHPYRMKPMGSPDVYAGRPTLTTAAAVRNRFATQGSVLIGIDQKYLSFDNIEPSLQNALDREARELCDNRCGTMRLYHWSFGQGASPPPADSN